MKKLSDLGVESLAVFCPGRQKDNKTGTHVLNMVPVFGHYYIYHHITTENISLVFSSFICYLDKGGVNSSNKGGLDRWSRSGSILRRAER